MVPQGSIETRAKLAETTSHLLPSGGMRHQFMAWLPLGINGPKTAGFVDVQQAQVLDVGSEVIRLQIGRKPWLPWNRDDKDFPLELTLRLNRQTECARSLTHVIADMRPLSSNLSHDNIQRRFSDVALALKGCFMAQELELA